MCGCSTSENDDIPATYEQLKLEDIPASADVELDQNGYIKRIEGNYLNNLIATQDDARKAVGCLSDLMGCKDFNSEMRLYKVDSSMVNTMYIFHQYYNDIYVCVYITVLYVNTETCEIRKVDINYIPNISIDTEPKFTEDDLRKKIDQKYGIEIDGEPELRISSERAPRLIWAVNLKSDDVSYLEVDAVDGSIIHEESDIIED